MGSLILLLLIITRHVRPEQARVENSSSSELLVKEAEDPDAAEKSGLATPQEMPLSLPVPPGILRPEYVHSPPVSPPPRETDQEQSEQARAAEEMARAAAPDAVPFDPWKHGDRNQLAAESQLRQQLAQARQDRDAEARREAELRTTLQQEREKRGLLESQLARLTSTRETAERSLTATRLQTRQQDQELRQLSQQIERQAAELKESEESAQERQQKLEIVVYEGTSGVRRQPIFVECRAGEVIIHPEKISIPTQELEDVPVELSPLAVAIRALSVYRAEQNQQSSDNQPTEPYVLMIARPTGIPEYYGTGQVLTMHHIPFGYELIPQDRELYLGKADPEARRVMLEALEQARKRYEQNQSRFGGMQARSKQNTPQEIPRRFLPGDIVHQRPSERSGATPGRGAESPAAPHRAGSMPREQQERRPPGMIPPGPLPGSQQAPPSGSFPPAKRTAPQTPDSLAQQKGGSPPGRERSSQEPFSAATDTVLPRSVSDSWEQTLRELQRSETPAESLSGPAENLRDPRDAKSSLSDSDSNSPRNSSELREPARSEMFGKFPESPQELTDSSQGDFRMGQTAPERPQFPAQQQTHASSGEPADQFRESTPAIPQPEWTPSADSQAQAARGRASNSSDSTASAPPVWGSPLTTSRGSSGGGSGNFGASANQGAIRLEQPVSVKVFADGFQVGRQDFIACAPEQSTARVQRLFVESLQQEVARWGAPPEGIEWLPRLRLQVAPGGSRLGFRLEQLATDFGLPNNTKVILQNSPSQPPRYFE